MICFGVLVIVDVSVGVDLEVVEICVLCGFESGGLVFLLGVVFYFDLFIIGKF